MPIENRRGTCKVCGGPVYRQPNRMDNINDRWVHQRTSDWIDNPHEVDPDPEQPQEDTAP